MKEHKLSLNTVLEIAVRLADALQHAHSHNIIHCDIKPQNIIISKDGKVKVTDFGIAKAATSNTITSNVMGSVHYTSPEQARGGYSDEKSDIYSLGITMFEMLTGRVPFNGETTVAIAIKHIQEEMPSPKEFVQEVRRICDKYGILLIFDEVQTGMGRTGKLYAYEHFGVRTEMLSEVSGPQIPEYGRTDRGSEAVPDQPGGRFRG